MVKCVSWFPALLVKFEALQIFTCCQQPYLVEHRISKCKCLRLLRLLLLLYHQYYFDKPCHCCCFLLFSVLAIELLAACQGIEFLRPLKTTEPLEAVHSLVRKVVK